jgi:hypothetical protein
MCPLMIVVSLWLLCQVWWSHEMFVAHALLSFVLCLEWLTEPRACNRVMLAMHETHALYAQDVSTLSATLGP